MQKKILQIVLVIIFWDFLVFGQTLHWPQVKWSVTISNKHGIYELPHELPDNFRLSILKNQQISEKSQNFMELYPSALVNISKKMLKNRNWTFPVVCYFIWKVEFVSNILSMIEGAFVFNFALLLLLLLLGILLLLYVH